MGTAIAASVVFEATSLAKTSATTMTASTRTVGSAPAPAIIWPSDDDRPVRSIAAARQRPPPKSTRTRQGIFAKLDGSRMRLPGRVALGMRNIIAAAVTAITPSLTIGKRSA